MFGLVWFLVAAEALGSPFSLSTWETHLKAIDSSLPHTTVDDFEVCYYFDLAQTCAGQTVSTLLNKAPITNVLTWAPTAADCSKLLDKQRPALEEAASHLFGAAITSAATAGVTNFELLAQSWVLRVSHHALSVKEKAFVAAINSVTNWKTVHCDGTNLLYDGKTIAKPAFVGSVDCDILDTVYENICANGSCTLAQGGTCCGSNKSSACCQTHLAAVQSECASNINCAYKSTCCSLDSASACCTGVQADPCAVSTCTLAEGDTCCGSNKSSACCQAHLAEITDSCQLLECPKSTSATCCQLDNTYACCTGKHRCEIDYCHADAAQPCCDANFNAACCQSSIARCASSCVDSVFCCRWNDGCCIEYDT